MSLVLLVDDDAATRDTVSSVLRDHGHEVLTAGDAESGLALLEQHPVDLVLLDLGLPGIGGEEFLLRRSRLAAKAPVVVVTASGSATTAARVRELGANFTIAKPFNVDELVEVAAVLPQRSGSEAPLGR